MGSKRNRKKNKTKVQKLTNSQVAQNVMNSTAEEVLNNSFNTIDNSLRDALGLDGVQLSQADTLFKNNRWYLVSNMRQLLSQLYVEIGLIKTVVDVPVEDGLRGGINIMTKQLDEEQLEELNARMEQQDDLETFATGSKWNRLYGGGGVIIMTDQPASTELDWGKINEDSKLEFRAVDMWELFHAKQNTSNYGDAISGRDLEPEFYNYYGVEVHKSRVLVMKGLTAPSFVRPRLRGWGVSIVETLVRSINQYLKSTDLSFEVLDEFKVDYFKINGLASTLQLSDGDAKVRNRLALMNEQKNYQRAVVMDGDDDWQQKQLTFGGLSEVMSGIRTQVASDLRMPMTKIFGMSSAGFNSGEDDIENYNSSVESGVRSKGKPVILTMIKLRCQQLFGFVPDDLSFTYQALRVLSSEQQENVKNSQFNRLLQARQAGEISRLEFREMANKNELLPMPVSTDDIDDELGKPTADITKEPIVNSSYMEAPENFKGTRVAVVGIKSGNEILRGRRRDNKKWTCPAGHLEVGEDAKEGAIREVFEESGIRLLKSDLKLVCTKFIRSQKTNERVALFAYEAQIPKQEATAENDPDKEISEWRWVENNPVTLEMDYETAHAGFNDVFIKLLEK